MPWYFYNKGGSLVTPKPPGDLSPGQIVLVPLPYTEPEPVGFLFCNGQSVLKSGQYNALFAEIGTIYGSADTSHFNVPDLRGRFPRGIINSASGIGISTGIGGSKSHTHTFGVHDHTVSNPAHSHTVATHQHTMTHKHTLGGHRHSASQSPPGPATYTVSAATGGALNCQQDADQDSALSNHTHNNFLGKTDIKSSTNLGGASTSSNTADANVNSVSTTHISAASSGNNAVTETSSTVTQLPPFLTMSFLIKT